MNATDFIPFQPLPFLRRELEVAEQVDGTVLMRSRVPLGPVEDNWGQDRAAMKNGHFTGFTQMLGTEDFAVITSMGPISDRTREFLGAGDGAVLAVRRCLMGALREFMKGERPALAAHEQIDYSQTPPVSRVVSGDTDWRASL